MVESVYEFCRTDPSLMPHLQAVFDPKNIVDQVCLDTYAKPSVQQDSCASAEKNDSRLSLAISAINNNRVKLVGNGAFVVTDGNGLTPHAITLFPKTSCSCTSTKACYHIAACKMAIGLDPTFIGESGKPSLFELKRKERVKMEGPSGRKKPRKNDFQLAPTKYHQLPDVKGVLTLCYITACMVVVYTNNF